MSDTISLINFCCNFHLDLLRLGGSVASPDVSSGVEIVQNIFIANNLLLKLLRTFYLALKMILSNLIVF